MGTWVENTLLQTRCKSVILIKNKIYVVCSLYLFIIYTIECLPNCIACNYQICQANQSRWKLIRSVITITYHVRFVQLHNHNHLLQDYCLYLLFALALKYIQSNVYYWSSGALHDFQDCNCDSLRRTWIHFGDPDTIF